eukprot:30772-Pelagococcus_subviridis.AAC.5
MNPEARIAHGTGQKDERRGGGWFSWRGGASRAPRRTRARARKRRRRAAVSRKDARCAFSASSSRFASRRAAIRARARCVDFDEKRYERYAALERTEAFRDVEPVHGPGHLHPIARRRGRRWRRRLLHLLRGIVRDGRRLRFLSLLLRHRARRRNVEPETSERPRAFAKIPMP